MLKGELGRQSRTSISDTLVVRNTVSKPMRVGDERRLQSLTDSAKVPNPVVGGLKRVPGWFQNIALIALVAGRFGQPIADRVVPSTQTFVDGLISGAEDLTGRLNRGEVRNVDQLNYEEVDMVADGVLMLFNSVGFNFIDNDPLLGSQIEAFNAAYQKRMAGAAVRRYQDMYYEKNPEDKGRLDHLNAMIRVIEDCEARGVSAQECVRGFRAEIYEDRRDIPGMDNMREEDIMPVPLKAYLSTEPIGGVLNKDLAANNLIWDGRRRITQKQHFARRSERHGSDQKSANRNRSARRLG